MMEIGTISLSLSGVIIVVVTNVAVAAVANTVAHLYASKYGTMKIQVLVFCLRIQYSTRIGDRSVCFVVLVKRLRM